MFTLGSFVEKCSDVDSNPKVVRVYPSSAERQVRPLRRDTIIADVKYLPIQQVLSTTAQVYILYSLL